ncbi:right-handed parallel beta-helix repeat-containing protein [Neolewinella lacunae]|uniref:Right-handed parallel beta-helix repeat-containing protein n=1 Tax=Neolewinella lacunae TaxID=1517758 RepID=A0A923PHK2_9BACT|nr:right-handed parallel beta-helix repeat-containing protein [Neolewinella lacunae]MBC6994202.1 right-handed parallel beta-helix repeat-containing protein [Neolewinella lacunae]MDN3634639.1 right-handed parallel beta-helix repeat-containing protein [Neolewinella lacunae]
MKQLLLFACLSIFTLGLHAQVVYVDIDATGTADGSSWANAYTDLNLALLDAPAGAEVWIAEGVYVTPDSTSFFIDKALTVLGGFLGNETMASQADPSKNFTVLSGDVLGNDPVGAYDSLAYSDNNRVLFVTDTNEVSAYTVTLDGFTIANGGIAANFATGSLTPFAGAGLLSFAKIDASRLVFRANRASFGAAITSLFETANGSRYDNITVEGNFAGPNRQVYLRLLDDVQFTNSTFRGSGALQPSGMFWLINTNDIVIEDCSFKSIVAGASGGGIRADDTDDVTIRGCSFDSITATTGSAVFFINFATFVTDRERTADDHWVDNCTFTNCVASGTGRGAAIRFDFSNLKVTNSTIDNCITQQGIGGAMYFQSSNPTGDFLFEMSDTEWTNNKDVGAGGAICILTFGGTSLETTMDNVTFANNVSEDDGSGAGVYYQGDGNKLTVMNSEFTDNSGGFGALMIRGASEMVVRNTTFTGNGSLDNAITGKQGGALVAYAFDGSPGVTIDSCSFVEGQTTQLAGLLSGGGAMYLLGGDVSATPLTITNSNFEGNSSSETASGGAILMVSGFDVTMDNNRFSGNSAGGDGGAINVIVREENRDTLEGGVVQVNFPPFSGSIANSEFYFNSTATQGGAISTQASVFDLTNNVFADNSVGADGASGGAIIFNGNGTSEDEDGNLITSGSVKLTSTMVHNTFYRNAKGGAEGAVGEHIAIFQPGQTVITTDTNFTKLILLNNAFVLDEEGSSIEYEPAGTAVAGTLAIGDIEIESLGGNYFSGPNDELVDLGMAADIIGDFDLEGSALFQDPDADDSDDPNLTPLLTDPLEDNPLISGGVLDPLVPATGNNGNPRGEFPEIGAYELDWALTSVRPIEQSDLKMSFFPNPTVDVVNIQNNDANVTEFTVMVSDQSGRVVKATQFNRSNNRLSLVSLPSGVYNLHLTVNGQQYSKQIVKQ